MSASPAPRLEARTRWSAAARCPRWAALGGLGYEPAPATDQTRRYWARGRALGRFVADTYALKHGEESIIREKAVPWPGGILHGDVFVVPEGLPVEVKSSSSPSSIIDDALLQLAGQIHFDHEATDQGILALIDPSSYVIEEIPFRLTGEWRDQVEQRTSQIVAALAGGDLPPCVCSTPAQCSAKHCPYTELAWEDWAPPAAEDLPGEAEQIAVRMYQIREQRKLMQTAVDEYDREERELRARLVDEIGVAPGVEYHAGALRVKRTQVKGRETFSLSRARKAGHWMPGDDERFADFVKVGEPFDRWSVSRGDGEMPAEDFGDQAPF